MRPALVVGLEALEPGLIARILKRRAAAAGFDPELSPGTVSKAVLSAPAWRVACIRPASSSSDGTGAMPC